MTTPSDIVAMLFNGKPLVYTTLGRIPQRQSRVSKAKGLATRNKIAWADVLAAMTDEQRKQVDGA